MNLSDLIKKSLFYYDNQILKYKEYSDNTLGDVDQNYNTINIRDLNHNIKLTAEYEILGIFDNQTKIWCWAWLIPYLNYDETIISRKLMEYGLKLEPNSNTDDHFYIKSQLLNSRITIENSFELDIHLALCSYLIKDLFKFILPSISYLNSSKTKYITTFYLIK
jgi:hypothetical protein